MSNKDEAKALLEAANYAERYSNYIYDSAIPAISDLERQSGLFFDNAEEPKGGYITSYALEKVESIYGDLLALQVTLERLVPSLKVMEES